MEEEKKPQLPQESDVEASIEGPLDEKAPAPQGGQPPFPEGGVRAWSVAIGCAGVLFSTFGYVNAFGYGPSMRTHKSQTNQSSVFQEYYQTHQLIHETPSTISWIGSLQTFFLFGGSLVGGPLFDRFGAKVYLSRPNISREMLIDYLILGYMASGNSLHFCCNDD